MTKMTYGRDEYGLLIDVSEFDLNDLELFTEGTTEEDHCFVIHIYSRILTNCLMLMTRDMIG